MSNGLFSLGDVQIGAAGTQIGVAVDDLDGILAAMLDFRFSPQGAAGTSVKAYAQMSADQGSTWYDVACAAFTAAGQKKFNLSGLTPKLTPVTPTDGTLADDTAVDGLLGDRCRVKVVTVGTWGAGSLLTCRLTSR